jgi:citrate lyase subunit beta / citryl-CoA lyase
MRAAFDSDWTAKESSMSSNAVTFLFVPGDRPERFSKAIRAGADVVILDIEDAVAPKNKDTARQAISSAWAALAVEAKEFDVDLCIRINALHHPDRGLDLDVCRRLRPSLIMVPKVESKDELVAIADCLPSVSILALIETAMGILEAPEIANAPRVDRLVLGSVDLMLNLGVSNDKDPLNMVRSMLLVASVAAGLAGPVDGVCTSIDDPARIEAEAALGRQFGFTGKLCIHPKQIASVRQAFEITAEELAWAKRIVNAAAATNGGAILVDGSMVDAPVLRRAELTILRATNSGLLDHTRSATSR